MEKKNQIVFSLTGLKPDNTDIISGVVWCAMGKSEVARLPVTRHQARLNLLIPEKQVVEKMTLEVNNNNNTISNNKKKCEYPPDVEVLNNQVAGHMDDGKALGKLQLVLIINYFEL